MSSAEISLFNGLLSQLVSPSQRRIAELTAVAAQCAHVQRAVDVQRAVEQHVACAQPQCKLATLYLLDSICRAMPQPYVHLFAQRLPSTFSLAYTSAAACNASGHAYAQLLQAWISVFPPPVLSATCAMVRPALGDALMVRLQQQWCGAHSVVSAPPSTSTTHRNRQRGARSMQSQRKSVRLPTDREMRNVTHRRANPVYSDRSKRLRVAPPPAPRRARPKTPELTDEYLRGDHPENIEALYFKTKFQCKQCALRLRTSEALAEHLDWHYRRNRNAKKSCRSRRWMNSSDAWAKSTARIGDCAQDTDAFSTQSLFGTARDSKVVAVDAPSADKGAFVPADDDQSTCPVCMEQFNETFDVETDEWVFSGAMIGADNRIVHVACNTST